MGEPASLNRQTKESIRRFGGSTSPDLAWPKDKEDAAASQDAEDRFERMETMILKTLTQLQSATGTHRRSSSSSKFDRSGTGVGSSMANFGRKSYRFGESFTAADDDDDN